MKHLVVAIIAGHGGVAPGKQTKNLGIVKEELVESEITLKIAKELFASMLTLPVEPYLIREHDEYISLANRGKKAQDCDLVISIHVNAHKDKEVQGADLFYMPDKKDSISKRVAIRTAGAMPPELHTGRIWSALDPRFPRVEKVMRYHNKPALLVECGYATNDYDRQFIITSQGISDIVNAIKAGIIHFWRIRHQERNNNT